MRTKRGGFGLGAAGLAAVAGFLSVALLWSMPVRADEVTPTADEIDAAVSLQIGERWYGVYLLGSKVGWLQDRWSIAGGELCVASRFKLTMSFLARKSEIYIEETSCFEAKPPFAF
jgi:hypothetical protein